MNCKITIAKVGSQVKRLVKIFFVFGRICILFVKGKGDSDIIKKIQP